MKTISKIILLFALILTQSCSDDDDNQDCSTALCAQPVAILDFQIVDMDTGENLLGTVLSTEDIEITNTASDTEPEFMFYTEDDINFLRIFISENSDYSISHNDDDIFSLFVEAERIEEGCCAETIITELSIEGAEFERNNENGFYLIKKRSSDFNSASE